MTDQPTPPSPDPTGEVAPHRGVGGGASCPTPQMSEANLPGRPPSPVPTGEVAPHRGVGGGASPPTPQMSEANLPGLPSLALLCLLLSTLIPASATRSVEP